jgi:hypothetical protein
MGQETGLPIQIAQSILLISNPLNVDGAIENWQRAGLQVPKFFVSTINADYEFDKFVSQAKEHDLVVIVDPVFDMHGNLSSGFVVENYH